MNRGARPDGPRVPANVAFSPMDGRRQELAEVVRVVDAVPDQSDPLPDVAFRDQVGERVAPPAHGAGNIGGLRQEYRVGVQEEDFLLRVRLQHPRDVLRFVVHDGEHPVSARAEALQRRRLAVGDPSLPSAFVHLQQVRVEGDAVFPPQRVERAKGVLPQRLGAPGVEPHTGAGLQREPADDLHDAAIGAVRRQDRLRGPTPLEVPGVDGAALGLRQRQAGEEATTWFSWTSMSSAFRPGKWSAPCAQS